MRQAGESQGEIDELHKDRSCDECREHKKLSANIEHAIRLVEVGV